MQFLDRVQQLRRVRACDLVPHPHNWRKHPPSQQQALCGVLEEIGFAGALLVRELDDGRLQLIDGHLRAETAAEAEVPVLVVDLDDAEAEKLLVTFDPLAAMAEADPAPLAQLLACVSTSHEGVQHLLDQVAASTQELAAPTVEPPPPVTHTPCFQLVVECNDEAHQEELYDRLQGEGLRCRVLTL